MQASGKLETGIHKCDVSSVLLHDAGLSGGIKGSEVFGDNVSGHLASFRMQMQTVTGGRNNNGLSRST